MHVRIITLVFNYGLRVRSASEVVINRILHDYRECMGVTCVLLNLSGVSSMQGLT